MKPTADASKDKNKDNEKAEDKKKDEEKEKPTAPPLTPAQEIKANVGLIERGVTTLEPRFMHRVLRNLTAIRKKLTNSVLRDALEEVYVQGTSI